MHPSRRQYELAHHELYSLYIELPCVECEEMMTVRVDGLDVRITTPCVNACHLLSHYDRAALDERAVDMAEQERHNRAQHEAEYDPR